MDLDLDWILNGFVLVWNDVWASCHPCCRARPWRAAGNLTGRQLTLDLSRAQTKSYAATKLRYIS